jgi:tRNA threonylcarbamoyladenosine dehydratase
MGNGIFLRSELLLGEQTVGTLHDTKVIIFGIGGVGSWCAESLIRTGITDLTMVDCDRVCITNINRQLMATSQNIGQVKTDVLKQRLLDINPEANITAIQKKYSEANSHEFDLSRYGVIIDAIDSMSSKIHLMVEASKTQALFVSSMGAALKIDPTKVRTDLFWNIHSCPLARRIRKRVRREGKTIGNFPVVYSEEQGENKGHEAICTSDKCFCSKTDECKPDPELSIKKTVINGSLAHITGIFGLTIAGLVVQHIYNNTHGSGA